MSNDEHETSQDRDALQDGAAPSPRAANDRVVHLDLSWLVPADLFAVDALARLQVAASRCGGSLLLHGADGGLIELLEFVGLRDVVHLCPYCPSFGPRSERPVGGS
jgi:hypothetical protein